MRKYYLKLLSFFKSAHRVAPHRKEDICKLSIYKLYLYTYRPMQG